MRGISRRLSRLTASATNLVVARDRPRSNNVMYARNDHDRDKMPNDSAPSRLTTYGTQIAPMTTAMTSPLRLKAVFRASSRAVRKPVLRCRESSIIHSVNFCGTLEQKPIATDLKSKRRRTTEITPCYSLVCGTAPPCHSQGSCDLTRDSSTACTRNATIRPLQIAKLTVARRPCDPRPRSCHRLRQSWTPASNPLSRR
jgi:hypothetical protein